MQDDDDLDLEFTASESEDNLDKPEYFEARTYASGEITQYAVDMLEYYSDKMPRNEALGMIIEALSVSLGNLISLVKEDHQSEVIDGANQVIQMVILAQTELIASMAYGQIGHG